MILAAIDIGSNAARLLICESSVYKDGTVDFTKLTLLRIPLRRVTHDDMERIHRHPGNVKRSQPLTIHVSTKIVATSPITWWSACHPR